MSVLLLDDNGVSLTAAPSGVMTLCIDRGQNVFNPALITSLSAALDLVEEREHPKALVITGTSISNNKKKKNETNKFFSNGLDLDFLSTNPGPAVSRMIEGVWRVLSRILVADCRTVAAVNGHGFGAGLFLALACDFRIMRTQRGYLNWPELNLGMPLAVGFAELTKAKVSDVKVWREGVLTGKRYDCKEALRVGLVDKECDVGDLHREATALAEAGLAENMGLMNFVPESFRQMKIELYTDAYKALTYGKADNPPVENLKSRL